MTRSAPRTIRVLRAHRIACVTVIVGGLAWSCSKQEPATEIRAGASTRRYVNSLNIHLSMRETFGPYGG